jgi:hypothetical protein
MPFTPWVKPAMTPVPSVNENDPESNWLPLLSVAVVE